MKKLLDSCNRLKVPKKVCDLSFREKDKEYDYSHSDDQYVTVRGEQMIIDLDAKGRVLSIELLESMIARKPCFHTTRIISREKKGRLK